MFFFREETSEFRLRQVIENDTIDAKYGFERVKEVSERTGYLLNMHAVKLSQLYLIFSHFFYTERNFG